MLWKVNLACWTNCITKAKNYVLCAACALLSRQPNQPSYFGRPLLLGEGHGCNTASVMCAASLCEMVCYMSAPSHLELVAKYITKGQQKSLHVHVHTRADKDDTVPFCLD